MMKRSNRYDLRPYGTSLLLLGLLIIAAGCRIATHTPAPAAATATATLAAAAAVTGKFLFDDFAYVEKDQMRKNGWILRDAPGWPGVPGAKWSADHIELIDDPDRPGNRLVQMTAGTDGSFGNTRQAQFCHCRKYFEGTYATRVRFQDKPRGDNGGDQIVETFYQISPSKGDFDPQYSELDFEYLANGGWGTKGPTLFVTSWETFRLEPWKALNESTRLAGSLEGWHTLVLSVKDGEVRYYLDGKQIAKHGGKNYPRIPMAMSYNLWFIREGLAPAGETREYIEWVDWAYYEDGVALTPAEVEERVRTLREAGTTFNDSVDPGDPALESPCNF
jgi:hypothetical protein